MRTLIILQAEDACCPDFHGARKQYTGRQRQTNTRVPSRRQHSPRELRFPNTETPRQQGRGGYLLPSGLRGRPTTFGVRCGRRGRRPGRPTPAAHPPKKSRVLPRPFPRPPTSPPPQRSLPRTTTFTGVAQPAGGRGGRHGIFSCPVAARPCGARAPLAAGSGEGEGEAGPAAP